MTIVRDARGELNGRRQETMPTRAIQRQCSRRNTSLTVPVATKVSTGGGFDVGVRVVSGSVPAMRSAC